MFFLVLKGEALQLSTSRPYRRIQRAMLAPTKNFGRSLPLYDAMVHLGIQALIATKICVERAALQAFVAYNIRYF